MTTRRKRQIRRNRVRAKVRRLKRKLMQKPIICCRVSGEPQVANGNLDDQMDGLIEVANRQGGGFVAVYDYVGSGSEIERWSDAVKLAKETGAPLFFESEDRMVRPEDFHPYRNPDARLTEKEQARLDELFAGVEVVFLNEGI